MTRSDPTARLIASTLGAALLALFSSGCVTHHYHYGSSAPANRVRLPPATPADGYLYAFDGVTLVFDRSWGGYRVRDHADHFFHLDFYYRYRNDAWERCARLAGPWLRIEAEALPVGLRAHHNQRKDARQEHREDRRDARHEQRDEVKGQRAESRDEAKEQREDRRDLRHQDRDDAKEQRAKRREDRTDQRDEANVERVERRVVKQDQREQLGEAKQTEPKQPKQHGKDHSKDGMPANQAD